MKIYINPACAELQKEYDSYFSKVENESYPGELTHRLIMKADDGSVYETELDYCRSGRVIKGTLKWSPENTFRTFAEPKCHFEMTLDRLHSFEDIMETLQRLMSSITKL